MFILVSECISARGQIIILTKLGLNKVMQLFDNSVFDSNLYDKNKLYTNEREYDKFNRNE